MINVQINKRSMLTPFSRYLQSNQAPSDDESREIKALRAIPLKELSIIDVEIERLEATLNSLKRKRANIQESIDDFNTILSPVRRLSTDVLGVIFDHCLATHRNPVMSPSEAPILLTQICRDWRSIALSIPRLWSRLYIPVLPRIIHTHTHCHPESLPYFLERERRMEARTEEVQRWLRLSAACPLAITLMPANDPVTYPPLLNAIIESSRRWQQLELGCLSPDSLTRLLSLTPDDLCMLRELRIYSIYSTVNLHLQEVQEDLWYQSGLMTAQGLRSISIADMRRTNAFSEGIPPNWKNLNHLFIHCPILLGLAHSMLSHCCNLAACLLEIAGQWDDVPNALVSALSTAFTTLSSCILPRLTFLSLQGDASGCNQLFSSIVAPSLQLLDYQGYFPSESEDFGLLNLLQNIYSLETLRVDHYDLTESNVFRYFTLVPSVTHLVLGQSPKRSYRHYRPHNPHLSNPENVTLIATLNEVRHQYSPDSAPTFLFPSLEVFEAYDIPGVTDTNVLEFIKVRIDATKSNAGVAKLKKVVVEFSGTKQTDIVPEALAYAQAAGIKLELDLTHYIGRDLDATWSPSFGLSQDDVSWIYPLYDH